MERPVRTLLKVTWNVSVLALLGALAYLAVGAIGAAFKQNPSAASATSDSLSKGSGAIHQAVATIPARRARR